MYTWKGCTTVVKQQQSCTKVFDRYYFATFPLYGDGLKIARKKKHTNDDSLTLLDFLYHCHSLIP